MTVTATTAYVLFHAVLGATLGFRAPRFGIALLVALISVTASFSWHLGIGVLPATHAYLLGLLAAVGARGVARGSGSGSLECLDRLPRHIRVCLLLVFLSFLGPMLVAIFREQVSWPRTPAVPLRSVLHPQVHPPIPQSMRPATQ